MGLPITLLAERRTDELQKLLARYAELAGKAIPELLTGTAIRFARAAFRASRPAAGSVTIPNDKLYRHVTEFSDGRARVRWRTRKGSWKRFFRSPEEVGTFRAIMNRGAAKYGWAGALVDLGQPLPRIVPASFPFAGKAPELAAKLSHGVPATPSSPFAEVRNSGDYVSQEAMNAGLRLVNSGLARSIKKLEEDMANGLR